MSSNRLSYDLCSYQQELKQSIKPVNYMLDPVRYYNCNKCAHTPAGAVVGGTMVSNINGNLVDLESSLSGRTQVRTKCPIYEWKMGDGDKEIVSKEYTKLNKHAPIDTTLKPLKDCEFIDARLAPAAEPPMDLFKCPA